MVISADSVASHRGWDAGCPYPFPVLSDAGGAVREAYGVRNLLGHAKRAMVLVDGNGKIRHESNKLPVFYQHPDHLLSLLERV